MRRLAILAAVAAAAALASCRVVPVAQTGPVDWSRGYLVKPVPGSPAVLYLWLTNPTGEADTVLTVHVTGADSAQVHRTVSMGNGMERMVPVADLTVPAHDTVRFAPGGFHIMVFGLPSTLQAGDSTAVTVTFQTAGDRTRFAHVITYAQVDSAVVQPDR